jgi:hypothetical protein
MTGNQVVSTMFNAKTFIHMARIVPSRDKDEELLRGPKSL